MVAVLTWVLAIGGSSGAFALARAARRAASDDRVRGLAARRRWRVPRRMRGWMERALVDAAIELEPEAACELWIGTTLGVAIVCVAASPGLLVPGVVTAALAGPIVLRGARGRAQRRYVAALPGVLEQVAAAQRGGAGLDQAIEAVVTSGGPLSSDLGRVRARCALGSSLVDSLTQWSAERPLRSVRAAAGALAVASTVGGAGADALDGLAVSLRERLGATADARALSSQARLSGIVVGAAPIAYLGFSAVADPASVATLVGTSAGRVCLVAGLALDGIAILWMRRLLRSDDDQ